MVDLENPQPNQISRTLPVAVELDVFPEPPFSEEEHPLIPRQSPSTRFMMTMSLSNVQVDDIQSSSSSGDDSDSEGGDNGGDDGSDAEDMYFQASSITSSERESHRLSMFGRVWKRFKRRPRQFLSSLMRPFRSAQPNAGASSSSSSSRHDDPISNNGLQEPTPLQGRWIPVLTAEHSRGRNALTRDIIENSGGAASNHHDGDDHDERGCTVVKSSRATKPRFRVSAIPLAFCGVQEKSSMAISNTITLHHVTISSSFATH